MDIEFTDKISIEDYRALRSAVGFKNVSARQAEVGLENSVLIVAKVNEKPVGMARVITDGGYFNFWLT